MQILYVLSINLINDTLVAFYITISTLNYIRIIFSFL